MHPLHRLIQENRLEPSAVQAKQDWIFDDLLFQSSKMRSPNFSTIETNDLQLMFDLYDHHFFEGLFRKVLLEQQTPLNMRISKRMTSAGGKTTMVHPHGPRSNRQKTFEIAISSTLLFESFNQGNKAKVVGLECENRLEGLQRIFEHELIHLMEMLVWIHSSCAQRRFRILANQWFRHRESKHQLTTPGESASKVFGIHPGDLVEFSVEGQTLVGFVNRITRRATVLVPDRKGELFDDGERYRKYYVPLNRLSKRNQTARTAS